MEHLHGCDDGGGCIMHSDISTLKGDVGYLKKAINGNGEPGLLKDFREHRNQFAAHREEFQKFVGTYEGVIAAEKEALSAKEIRDSNWRWLVGGLCTLLLALFLLILGILLKEPLRDRGVISHDKTTVVDQMSSEPSIR